MSKPCPLSPKGEIEMPASPTILRRYLSTFIDGIFISSVFIAASFSVTSDSALATNVRIAVLFLMIFFYEPIFTSRLAKGHSSLHNKLESVPLAPSLLAVDAAANATGLDWSRRGRVMQNEGGKIANLRKIPQRKNFK